MKQKTPEIQQVFCLIDRLNFYKTRLRDKKKYNLLSKTGLILPFSSFDTKVSVQYYVFT